MTAAREALGDGSVGNKRPGIPVAQSPARRLQFSSIDGLGMGTGEGIGRIVMVLSGMEEKASDRSARGREPG